MQLPSARTANAQPDLASLANAQHMWEFLDELSTSDPAEYQRFLAKQLETATPKPRMPDAGFCVRATTGSQRTPLWINVCSHPSMKPPSSTPDGSVPIAVGVPRPATVASETGNACDVVVACEVTDRAARDAGFREEVAALAVECVTDVLTAHRKLPSHQRIQPGYRALPPSRTPYAGERVAFVDAREEAGLGSGVAAGAAAAGSGVGLPAGFDAMLQQLSGIAGGDSSGMAALAAQVMGGGRGGGGGGGGRGGGRGGEARRGPDTANAPCRCGSGRRAEQCCGATGGGGMSAGAGVLSPAAVAGWGDKQAEEGGEAGGLGGQLRLPGTGTAPKPAKPVASGEAARRPLVEVVASQTSEPAVPSHTLETGAEAMVLRVELPLVHTAADLDVDLGDSEVRISAEGVYRLALTLPAPVESTRAACKFEKRKRRLTVTMPLAR
jgi:hypothetical protein